MENTVAFSVLMELISVLGSFVTTPMFFGLSVLNILVILFIFNMVIGVCLGGISPRLFISRERVSSSSESVSSSSFDEKLYVEYLRAGGKPF